MSGYLPAGVNENDPTAPWNQNYKDVIVNVDVTLMVTRTIQLVMSVGYSDRDVFDEVSRYIKGMTITDDYNHELTIDDFEIYDYYE